MEYITMIEVRTGVLCNFTDFLRAEIHINIDMCSWLEFFLMIGSETIKIAMKR